MNDHVYVEILQKTLNKHAALPCLHIKRNGEYDSWTYQDFHNDLNRLSSQLKKIGLKRGNNAIVIGENSPEWLIAHHSIILTGACAVPVDPNIPSSEIELITKMTEAKIIFCTSVYLSLFKELKAKSPFLSKIILLDKESTHKDTFENFIKNSSAQHDSFTSEFHPDDPMVIIFTSGTTGKAKGVVLCQKNFTAVANHAVPRMNLTSEDTACAVLPLHHVFGFAACLSGPLAAGADIVFVPYVKGPLILEALRDKKVTYLPAVPKMLSLFYDSIIHNVKKKGPVVQTLFAGMKTISTAFGDSLGDSFKRNLFSSVHKSFGGKLRLIISGGASLNKRHWIGFRQMGFTIVEGYGLTETFGPITVTPRNDVRWGSVGPALNENEIKIDQPNKNGIGEVLLRGTCVFKGYYNNDKITQDVFDNEGWFHTGDLGRLDKNDFLFLSGRKKDMIVLDSGKNVYPDELEDIFSASPLIEEIGVFGVQKDSAEIVAAIIVPTKEIRMSNSITQVTDQIYNELNRIGKSLPVYRRISNFVTSYKPLPRTTTKKLKKQELRKLYSSIKRKTSSYSHSDEQLSVIEMALMETEEYTSVVNAISEIIPKVELNIINPRSHLELDLGLDSLQRIELLTKLEQKFHITVSEDIVDKLESVTDLVSLIRESSTNHTITSIDKVMNLKERIINDSQSYVSIPKGNASIPTTAYTLLQNTGFQFGKPKIFGIDHLDSIKSPIIFASNHGHANDIFTILESLPYKIRQNSFFLSESPIKKTTLLRLIYRYHLLNIDKKYDPIETLRMSIAVIRNRKNLIVFPEGKISEPGVLGEFKSGISFLAQETAATIVPIKIAGPLHLASSQNKSNKISLHFGKPLTYKDLFADQNTSNNNSVKDALEKVRHAISTM